MLAFLSVFVCLLSVVNKYRIYATSTLSLIQLVAFSRKLTPMTITINHTSNLLFGHNLAETFTKEKKIGPKGYAYLNYYYVDPPLGFTKC